MIILNKYTLWTSTIIIVVAIISFILSQSMKQPFVNYTDQTTLVKNGLQKTSQGKLLDLSGQNLTHLPQNVLKQTDLQELYLSNNKLTDALPAEIRFLSNLRRLDVSHNLMTGVPAEVGQLKNLEALNLSYNRLTGLPYELGNLLKLKELNLTGNNYTESDLEIILKRLPNRVKIIK